MLWPTARRGSSWFRPSSVRFVAVPDAEHPKQLLPWRPTTAVGAMRRVSDDRARRRSLLDGAGTLGLLLVTPFSGRRQVVLDDVGTALLDQIRDEVDRSIVSATVMCGPVRANQKPVLQALDRWGRTKAFVKVGWNPLTTQLLEDEQSALERLGAAPTHGLVVPAVVGRGTFAGGSWMAISPIRVERRVAPSPAHVITIARAIEATVPAQSQALSASRFATELVERSAGLPVSAPAVAALMARHGDREVSTAAAHGDFVPWNVLTGEPRSAVWDWERSTPHAPIGFDRWHHAFQVELFRRKRSTHHAHAAVLARLGDLVPELSRSDAELSFDCYVADVMCRYEHDADEHTPALAQRATDLSTLLSPPGSQS